MIISASLTLEIDGLVILSFFHFGFHFYHRYLHFFHMLFLLFGVFIFFITTSSDCIVLVFSCLFYDVFRWCIEMCLSVFNSFAHSTVATLCLTK